MTNDRYDPNKLYRDKENGKWMGVCAGLADYFGIKPGVARLLVVCAAIFTSFMPVLITYFILGMALDQKPASNLVDPAKEEFWREARVRPQNSALSIKRRFRQIDDRIANMEAYMTSRRFRLERELQGLED